MLLLLAASIATGEDAPEKVTPAAAHVTQDERTVTDAYACMSVETLIMKEPYPQEPS